MRLLVLALAALTASPVNGFYLPGVAPKDYEPGDEVSPNVNKLDSTKTQMPYDFYSLPWGECEPSEIKRVAENLGEVLRGDRIETSMYSFRMQVPEMCNIACRLTSISKEDADAFLERIVEQYRVYMVLDNLPVAMAMARPVGEDGAMVKTYDRGYYLGFEGITTDGKQETTGYYINNHLKFNILYHQDSGSGKVRIVGFEVEPVSIAHEMSGSEWRGKDTVLRTCNGGGSVSPGNMWQAMKEGEDIIFTYDVSFEPSDIKWASRWDTYLLMTNDEIHWFSIINSTMIVFFLTGMVAMIILRTLHRDITQYNQLETQEEAQEETGWKLVHGDVFRPPSHFGMLCVHAGSGVQIIVMAMVTLVFACLGFLSPANRGGLMTALVMLFVFSGSFAGYFSARLYKYFKGTEWKTNTLLTAFLTPGVIFVIFSVLNTMLWAKQSSGAIPFGTFVAIIFLWFGISIPLVFLGSYAGFKKDAMTDPVRTNKIPRQVPEQEWYFKPAVNIMVGGILPFCAIFIELFFIMTSLWLHQFYYIFGFLLLVFIILFITCAEISIVLCYFQLCAEDYHWWWRAYLNSGSSAVYVFLYSIFYYATKLDIMDGVATALYFGYMLMISYVFFLFTGSVGFYSCLTFVRKIYAAVKLD